MIQNSLISPIGESDLRALATVMLRKPQMWVNQLEKGYFSLEPEIEGKVVEAIERVGKFIDGALSVDGQHGEPG